MAAEDEKTWWDFLDRRKPSACSFLAWADVEMESLRAEAQRKAASSNFRRPKDELGESARNYAICKKDLPRLRAGWRMIDSMSGREYVALRMQPTSKISFRRLIMRYLKSWANVEGWKFCPCVVVLRSYTRWSLLRYAARDGLDSIADSKANSRVLLLSWTSLYNCCSIVAWTRLQVWARKRNASEGRPLPIKNKSSNSKLDSISGSFPAGMIDGVAQLLVMRTHDTGKLWVSTCKMWSLHVDLWPVSSSCVSVHGNFVVSLHACSCSESRLATFIL